MTLFLFFDFHLLFYNVAERESLINVLYFFLRESMTYTKSTSKIKDESKKNRSHSIIFLTFKVYNDILIIIF